MASQLRYNYTKTYPRFSGPPGWAGSNDLGYASTHSAGSLLAKLGLGTFKSPGNDYVQDVLKFLLAALDTNTLNGLFTDVIQRGNKIEILAAPDMYNSSSGGAIMIKFIKALLADADNSGRIAMPGRTFVSPGVDKKSVIVEFDLQK
jgi:hypothetical protein